MNFHEDSSRRIAVLIFFFFWEWTPKGGRGVGKLEPHNFLTVWPQINQRKKKIYFYPQKTYGVTLYTTLIDCLNHSRKQHIRKQTIRFQIDNEYTLFFCTLYMCYKTGTIITYTLIYIGWNTIHHLSCTTVVGTPHSNAQLFLFALF